MIFDINDEPPIFNDLAYLPDGSEVRYTITQRTPRPGFLAWLARLFRLPRGWDYFTESGVGTIYKSDGE